MTDPSRAPHRADRLPGHQRPGGQVRGRPRRVTPALDYRQLYQLWERQQWATQDVDFTQDRIDWHERIGPEERYARMYGLSSFFIGEQRVAAELGPMMRAAPQRGHAALPLHPDRRRGAPRRVLRPLLRRGRRARVRQPPGPPGRDLGRTSTTSSACSSTRCSARPVDRLARGARGPRDARRGGDDLPHGRRGDAGADRPALHHRLQRAAGDAAGLRRRLHATSRATSTATSRSARASCATCRGATRATPRRSSARWPRSGPSPTACCGRRGRPTTPTSSLRVERQPDARARAQGARAAAEGHRAARRGVSRRVRRPRGPSPPR